MSFIVGLEEEVLQHGISVRRSQVRATIMYILLHVIIPVYRIPYSGTHVAQTSGGRPLTSTWEGEC
jgi:hypothetical protein